MELKGGRFVIGGNITGWLFDSLVVGGGTEWQDQYLIDQVIIQNRTKQW